MSSVGAELSGDCLSLRIIHCDYYMMKWNGKLHRWKLRNVFDGSDEYLPVLRIFGSNDSGHKCCLHVHGVFPYFYIRCPTESANNQSCKELKAALNVQLSASFSRPQAKRSSFNYVRSVNIVNLTSFYGYHSKESKFFKITLYNPAMVTKAAYLCHSGKVCAVHFQVFEAHLPYTLQFFIDYNLYGMDMIIFDRARFRKIHVDVLQFPGNFNGSTVKRAINWFPPQTKCSVEMDCFEMDIANPNMPCSMNLKNPGLKYIWKDEAERRRTSGDALPFEYAPASQEERNNQRTKSSMESFYLELLDEKLAGIVGSTQASSDRSVSPGELLIRAIIDFPNEELETCSQRSNDSTSQRNGGRESGDIFGTTDADASNAEYEEERQQHSLELQEQAEMNLSLDNLLSPCDYTSPLNETSPFFSQLDGPPEMANTWQWFKKDPDQSETRRSSESDSSEDFEDVRNRSPKISQLDFATLAPNSCDRSYSEQESSIFNATIHEELNNTLVPLESDDTIYCVLFPQAGDKLKNAPSTSTAYDATVNSSYGFDVTTIGTSNVDAVNLTIMSLELYISGRPNLKPDPSLDAVSAIFVSIRHVGLQSDCFSYCLINAPGVKPTTIPTTKSFIDNHDFTQMLVESELGLFQNLEYLLESNDPDILVGFEVEMLSWGYLFDRANHLDYDLYCRCSRIIGDKGRFPSTRRSSWMLTDSISVTGRITLNLWMLMRSVVTLRLYTFENVVYHVLRMRIPYYSPNQLNRWFQSSLTRWRVIEYYLIRAYCNVQVLVEQDLVHRTAELARLFGIQFLEVLTRGSQFRVESMMLRMTKNAGYVAFSPTPQERNRMHAPECLPLTMEPESNFYTDPVLVLDFQSLYPSICIAYNYCYSTCLGKVTNLVANDSMQFGCATVDLPLAQLKMLRREIAASPNGVLFVSANVRRGILPQMLEEILNTRIMVKKCAKKYANDRSLVKVLDARQLGLKLISNVTYGYTSANFSGRMPCVEIADSIVQKGRETLESAIRMVNSNPHWRGKVIYGDTDSMFVLLLGRSKEEAFAIGADIAEAVTAANPYPIKLKFEKDKLQPSEFIT